MQTSKRILKNLFSLSLAEIATKGITYFSMFYLARVIEIEGFGVIGYANTVVLYFWLFVNMGFSTVGMREIAKDKSKIKKYTNVILTIRFTLAIIAYFVLALIVLLLNKPFELKFILMIAGINVFSNAIMVDWVYQGIEKMEYIALRSVFTSVLNFIGIIIFVQQRNDTTIAMIITVVSTAINAIWMLILYIKLYGPIKIDIDKELIKEICKSSIPIASYTFLITVLNSFNMLMLGSYSNERETGLYFSAYKMLLVTLIPTGIIQNSFFPLISRSNTLEEKQKVTEKYTLLLFIFGTIFTFVCFTFAEQIVLIIYGTKFYEVPPIMQVLMITSLIMYINVTFSIPLIAWSKEKLIMYIIAIGTIVNVVLNIYLIPIHGAYGAAIATVFSEISIAIPLIYFYYKIVRKSYLTILFKLMIYSLISSLAGYALFTYGLNVIISGIISVIIYIFINFIFKTITITELKKYLINK